MQGTLLVGTEIPCHLDSVQRSFSLEAVQEFMPEKEEVRVPFELCGGRIHFHPVARGPHGRKVRCLKHSP